MSDLDKKYPLRLDTRINFKNLIPHFYISDNQTNDFYIKLTNDNKPVEVEDIIVVIAVINPNGNINSSFLDTKTEKGLIYCNLPNELKNVVGVYKARIMCISGEERIVSNTFEYKVDTDEFQVIDEITEDSEEMIVLSQMLSRLSNMEIESQANETERTANENERIANEAERIENENLRQQAENNRNTTEEARVVAESNRISNESERVLGEQTRVENEQTRVENEQNRISAENERISNENIRKENENRRLEKENNNIQAESNRVQAESNRKNSENARNDNEDIRKQNELKRQSNENTRITNENERIANENERAKVNANRQQAEQTRVTNERNRKEAETARASAERNRANNESVRISNENIRKNNEEKRKEEFKAKIIEIDNALASLETDSGYPRFVSDTILAYIDKDNILERSEIQEGISQALNYVVTCPSGEVTIPDNEMDSSIKNLILTLSDISIELGKSIKVSGAIIFQQNTSFYLYADSNYVEMMFYTSFQYYMVSCYLSEGDTQYDQISMMAVPDTSIASVALSGSYNDLTDKPIIPTAYNLPVANQTTLGGIKVGAGLSITADGILSATSGGTADSVNGIPSLVGSNENVVKIWELEDGVYNLSGILKYRYNYYSTETGGTLEGWQIEGLYIIYNAGDDPDNEGRTIKICKNLKYNFYFKYSLLNGTIESSRYDPEYIKEGNSNPIGEEEAITVLPDNLVAVDYYNLPVGIYRVTADSFFDATTNCELRNGLTNDILAFPNGSLISCEGQGLIINLSYSVYFILNDTGKVAIAGSTNHAWTGELATVAISGSYNDLTDKPTIPSEYNLPIANQTTLGGIKVGAGLSITADGILSATGGGTADGVNWENVVGKPTFATVATSGSYNDLTDKPTIPHYNETLMFEISGETDYGNFYANRYFNISALSLDETKSYVGKHKPLMDFPDELIHEFVYNKEANALMDEINSVYIYNHKSYNGTNFIEDENSAVLTYDIKPMAISSGYNGYFRLYEIEKLELNNNCLSDDVSIKNSLTVGSRIGDIGKYSVAEGNENTASGNCSHAEGISTIASGDYSHAEGDNTTASSGCSHAEGINTTASGDYSHAEGNHTRANGNASHAEGYYTIASTDFQHVQGRLNIEDTGRIYAHIVGNGMSDTERRNAYTLDWNGNGWYQGKLSQDGTPTEDKDLATKKYVDDSISNINDLPLLSSICMKNEDGSLIKSGVNYLLDFSKIPVDDTKFYLDDVSSTGKVFSNVILGFEKDGVVDTNLRFRLNSNFPIISLGYRTSDTGIYISNRYSTISYIINSNERTVSELYSLSEKVNKSQVITISNKTEYTPTDDYNPATKKYVDDSIATVNADTIDNLHIWTGTQSQYDALGTKDSNTIYLIKEG